jgi:hypothetical protein
MRLDSLLLALALAIVGVPAMAQTIYKLIDKNGKVSYSDTKPKYFDGQVIPLGIDPDANVAVSPKGAAGTEGAPAKSPYATQIENTRNAAVDRLQQAQDAYNAAKEAVEKGKDPLDEEWQTLSTPGGGGRRVPGEAYYARQSSLAEALKRAEKDLVDAERNYRRAN